MPKRKYSSGSQFISPRVQFHSQREINVFRGLKYCVNLEKKVIGINLGFLPPEHPSHLCKYILGCELGG